MYETFLFEIFQFLFQPINVRLRSPSWALLRSCSDVIGSTLWEIVCDSLHWSNVFLSRERLDTVRESPRMNREYAGGGGTPAGVDGAGNTKT